MSEFGAEWARIVLAAVGAVFSGLFIGGILGFGSMVALGALPSVREQMDGIEIVLLPFMAALGGAAAGPIGVISSLAVRKYSIFPKGRSKDVLLGGAAAAFCFAILATMLVSRDIAAGRSIWTSTKVLIVVELVVAVAAGGAGGWVLRKSFQMRRSGT